MPVQTPPSNLPTWGTDGGAEITDPGASKRATGFLTAEAPAAGHMNHQLKQVGDWVTYMQKALSPRIAMNNYDPTGVAFGTPGTTNQLHIKWVEGLGKFIAIGGATSGVKYAWESTDGITWSNETAIGAAGDVSKIASDGTTIVCFRYENELYSSSTGSVAGLTFRGNSMSALRNDMDVVWDETNNYYIATGGENVWTIDPDVEDVHDETLWDETKDFGVEGIEGIAVSDTGIAVVTFNAAIGTGGSSKSTDGGQTWSAIAGTQDFGMPIWSPATNCFFAYENTTNELHFSLNTSANSWANLASLAVEHLLVHEDFTLGVGPVSGEYAPIYFFQSTATPDFTLTYTQSDTFFDQGGGLQQFIEASLQGRKQSVNGNFYVIECTGASVPGLVWSESGDIVTALVK